MLARRRTMKVRQENASYWMSYSDIMAALLLMLILLLFFFVNQYLSMQQQREQEIALKETQLAAQASELDDIRYALQIKANDYAAALGQISNQQLEIDDKNLQLEQSLAAIALQQQQYDEQERLLNLSQEDVEDARALLEQQAAQLTDRENTLSALEAQQLLQTMEADQLRAILDAQKNQLETQQTQIEQLVGVRSRIIESLRDSLTAANLSVLVDRQTGAITLDSAVFFEFGKDTLKPGGRELLDQFIPIYVHTLLAEANQQYVAEVIIEGHTDPTGTYLDNLDLSQRRALAVVKYVLSESFTGLTKTEKEQLRDIVTANGRSWSNPVKNAAGAVDATASRRVEFKFRLKDAEMIDNMNRILSVDGQ